VPQEPKQKRDEEESDYDPGWILSPPMMLRHVPLAMPNFEFTEHLPRNRKGDPFSESPWVLLCSSVAERKQVVTTPIAVQYQKPLTSARYSATSVVRRNPVSHEQDSQCAN